jgi:hypothetical protein
MDDFDFSDSFNSNLVYPVADPNEFSIANEDLSGINSDYYRPEFTMDSSDVRTDLNQFHGADSMSAVWGNLSDLLGNVGGYVFKAGQSVANAYSSMDPSTKGLLGSMALGGASAYLQGRQQDKLLEAKLAGDREAWERYQNARRIPDGIKLGTAGGFK